RYFNYSGSLADDVSAIFNPRYWAYDLFIVSDEISKNADRRRSPRFLCGGQARLARLPSGDELLSGKLRDLSLKGCAIETASVVECGVRTELLIHVNASSFRAIGQ